eukprot:767992-Hanusia_phi.AAC.4
MRQSSTVVPLTCWNWKSGLLSDSRLRYCWTEGFSTGTQMLLLLEKPLVVRKKSSILCTLVLVGMVERKELRFPIAQVRQAEEQGGGTRVGRDEQELEEELGH